jgi:hypothetical protein
MKKLRKRVNFLPTISYAKPINAVPTMAPGRETKISNPEI